MRMLMHPVESCCWCWCWCCCSSLLLICYLLYQCEADTKDVEKLVNVFWNAVEKLAIDGDNSMSREMAQVAHAEICKNGYGMGHLSSLHALHLFALTGVVPAFYASVAFVSESHLLGPSLFFETYGEESRFDNSGQEKTIKMQFDELCKSLHDAGRPHIFPSFTENYLCGKARAAKKKELYFMYNGNLQSVIKVIKVEYRQSANMYNLKVLACGEWHPMSDLMTPVHKMENM
eukprot:scaffold30950_cov48-Attheya_sp.AAC.1